MYRNDYEAQVARADAAESRALSLEKENRVLRGEEEKPETSKPLRVIPKISKSYTTRVWLIEFTGTLLFTFLLWLLPSVITALIIFLK